MINIKANISKVLPPVLAVFFYLLTSTVGAIGLTVDVSDIESRSGINVPTAPSTFTVTVAESAGEVVTQDSVAVIVSFNSFIVPDSVSSISGNVLDKDNVVVGPFRDRFSVTSAQGVVSFRLTKGDLAANGKIQAFIPVVVRDTPLSEKKAVADVRFSGAKGRSILRLNLDLQQQQADFEIGARLASLAGTGNSINSIIAATDTSVHNRDIYVEVTRLASATANDSTLTVLVTRPHSSFTHQDFDANSTTVTIERDYAVQNSDWVQVNNTDSGLLLRYKDGKPATGTMSAFVISTAITPPSTDTMAVPHKLESIVQGGLSAGAATPTHNLFFQVLKTSQ